MEERRLSAANSDGQQSREAGVEMVNVLLQLKTTQVKNRGCRKVIFPPASPVVVVVLYNQSALVMNKPKQKLSVQSLTIYLSLLYLSLL